MSIVVNPGSGPVQGATYVNARVNMVKFCLDLVETGVAKESGYRDTIGLQGGRWSFTVTADGHEYLIEMPGLPLDCVRFMDMPDQNVWDFPRLYVDGSSWLWMFALTSCQPEAV
jgi:hypothetical protein